VAYRTHLLIIHHQLFYPSTRNPNDPAFRSILAFQTDLQQDKTPGRGYSRVIYFLIAIKAVQFCLGPIYDYLDGKLLGHSFRRSEKRRIAIREENFASGNLYRGWRVQRWATYVFGGQLVLMILTSWVVSGALALPLPHLLLSLWCVYICVSGEEKEADHASCTSLIPLAVSRDEQG
jgi:hypothetical protein